MYFLIFALAYSSVPRPSAPQHIHRTFQQVKISWVCEEHPGWYFVRPVYRECAPILYKSGWYVHHSHLFLVQLFASSGAEVRHA